MTTGSEPLRSDQPAPAGVSIPRRRRKILHAVALIALVCVGLTTAVGAELDFRILRIDGPAWLARGICTLNPKHAWTSFFDVEYSRGALQIEFGAETNSGDFPMIHFLRVNAYLDVQPLIHVAGIGVPFIDGYSIDVEAWPLAAACLAYPLFCVGHWAGGRAARRRSGCCAACGYNLTGNASGRCPECGTPIGVAAQGIASTSAARVAHHERHEGHGELEEIRFSREGAEAQRRQAARRAWADTAQG